MNERKIILTIYNDGYAEYDDITTAELRNIGQQLIAMADNVVIRGNRPQPEQAEEEAGND